MCPGIHHGRGPDHGGVLPGGPGSRAAQRRPSAGMWRGVRAWLGAGAVGTEQGVEAGGQMQVSGRPGLQDAGRLGLSRLPGAGLPPFQHAAPARPRWDGAAIHSTACAGLCDLGLLTHLSELPYEKYHRSVPCGGPVD